jgi:hypothetical protein
MDHNDEMFSDGPRPEWLVERIERHLTLVRLSNLATNLRWAAFGCAAFDLGLGTGVDVTCDPYNHERYWSPGSNKPAPGWG